VFGRIWGIRNRCVELEQEVDRLDRYMRETTDAETVELYLQRKNNAKERLQETEKELTQLQEIAAPIKRTIAIFEKRLEILHQQQREQKKQAHRLNREMRQQNNEMSSNMLLDRVRAL